MLLTPLGIIMLDTFQLDTLLTTEKSSRDGWTDKQAWLDIKFGPVYSPWSNGINKRNHASADIKIQKMMEDKKTPLTDALVKASAWTHITSVNKLGYSPLQLVTSKAVTIPDLNMGNEATENLADSEAIQRTLEVITKTFSEFREADMRKKLRECQQARMMSYQHVGN